jgi:hypothetical protein
MTHAIIACPDAASLRTAFASFARDLDALESDDEQPSRFLRADGRPLVPADDGMCRCTTTAEIIAAAFGGVVAGYSADDNPVAALGAGFVGGHDFAVIGSRFILDFWAAYCETAAPKPGFLDLADPKSAAAARALYGDPATWQTRAPRGLYTGAPGFTLPTRRS